MNHIEQLQAKINKPYSDNLGTFTDWLTPIIIEATEGKVRCKFTVRPDMVNAMGNLHGGVSAAIIDDMYGYAIYTLERDNFFTTINNEINYLSAAPMGSVIIAEATILKNGKQFLFAECIIWNEDLTKTVAKGTTNLFKTVLAVSEGPHPKR